MLLAFFVAKALCWPVFKLGVHWDPKSLSAELLSSRVAQHVLVPGVVPPQVQGFALLLAELWEDKLLLLC